MKKSLVTDFTTMMKIALPIIAQCLIGYLLIFIDTAFIGHHRVEGLSAINNVIIPYFAMGSFFIAFTQGLTIVLSNLLGAKRIYRARRNYENAFFYNQIISLLYLLFWQMGGRTVLWLIGARGEVLELAVRYLSILSLGYFFTGISLTCTALFQGFGKTTPILISSIIKSSLNILFNWVLIFGRLGFPEMGIAGAALGTLLSDLIGTVYLFITLVKEEEIPFRIGGIFRIKLSIFRKLLKISLPIGLDYILWHLGQIFLIFMLNRIDGSAAGAFGVTNVLIGLSYNLYMGIGIAALVLIGRSSGAGDNGHALRIGHLALFVSLILCLAIFSSLNLWPRQMVGFFTENLIFTDRLTPHIPLISLIIFPKAANVIVGYALKGRGDTSWLMTCQAIGTAIIIALSFSFLHYFHWGFKGILLAIIVDETWRTAANYLRFYRKNPSPSSR